MFIVFVKELSQAPSSSLTNLQPAWKTASLLTLVTTKHYSNFYLIQINNQLLFLWQNATILVPASCSKTDQLDYIPSHIHTESNSSVNLQPMFDLKAY